MRNVLILIGLTFTCSYSIAQQRNNRPVDSVLKVPVLVKIEEVFSGNPFAQYVTLKKMETKYQNSVFKDIYEEQVKNIEQFLGFPKAGVEGMHLPNLRQNYGNKIESPGAQYKLLPAISVIKEQAETHRIIIWGEEHHLPQTRSLYTELIRELWKSGFRYLAAETFTEDIEDKDLKNVNYHCGLYTRDPVFANAVNFAIKLGYHFIAYDNKDKERDKVQAEIINRKVFAKDPDARILILAGRSHCVEEKTADGWEPMGYCLKKITGFDPFTIYAPTMTERLTSDEEHPMYKYVAVNMSLDVVSILKDTVTNNLMGNGIYSDAYVFFPRVKITYDRPDWLFRDLKCKPISIPKELLRGNEPVLIQAFESKQLFTDIPTDQIVVDGSNGSVRLALAPGKYKIRAVYIDESISASRRIKVK